MSIFKFIHYLILLLLLSLPFMPIQILKYIYFIPLLLPTLWLITGKCPLSEAHKVRGDNASFTRSIYKNIFKNITEDQTSSLNTFLLVLIMVLVSTRFRNNCVSSKVDKNSKKKNKV